MVGIGSSNIDDYRSPFALADVEAMLQLALAGYDNYTLIPVPDLPDDGAWTRRAIDLIGRPDIFFTANPYVLSLFAGRLPLAHPVEAVPRERRTPVTGTQVRRELARGDGWIPLVPVRVADYLRRNGLDERFRASYGLHTLVMETIVID
jgi:nicotinamide mononucleotide adenylyltransferase